MTIGKAYRKAAETLISNEREQEAAEIICYLTGLNKDQLFLNFDRPFIEENKLTDIIERRISGEPLAYIIKNKPFYGYDFYVDERCLIPRYDSECLVERAIDIIKNRGYRKILDLMSGSGCLGISIAKQLKDVYSIYIDVSFSDISREAMAVCLKNSRKLLGYEPKYYIGDIYVPDNQKFDLIICNPPYIDAMIKNDIERQVADFEPHTALFAGERGLELYPKIVKKAYGRLNKRGTLMCEIGYDQAEAVSEIFINNGFIDVLCGCDLASRSRFICGDV